MKAVRPTAGRVLLALFSILGDVDGGRFLDLFAGTGRVGLTALERGASVTWVESLRERAQAIERALPALPADARRRAVVLSLELRRAVAWLGKRGLQFDVVFADPPYHEGWGASLLGVKGLEGLLAPGGVLVAEHSVREELTLTPAWELASRRDYGESRLSFLRAAEARTDQAPAPNPV